jgi:copper/silver efflux system protein
MIGGMVSSTVLTLIVTPAVYGLIKGWSLAHARHSANAGALAPARVPDVS